MTIIAHSKEEAEALAKSKNEYHSEEIKNVQEYEIENGLILEYWNN